MIFLLEFPPCAGQRKDPALGTGEHRTPAFSAVGRPEDRHEPLDLVRVHVLSLDARNEHLFKFPQALPRDEHPPAVLEADAGDRNARGFRIREIDHEILPVVDRKFRIVQEPSDLAPCPSSDPLLA